MPKIEPSKWVISLKKAGVSRQRVVAAAIGVGLVTTLAVVSLTSVLAEPEQVPG